MNDHDLSLLTDEEIRQEAEDICEQIDAAPVEGRIRALAKALMSARAENKRKDAMLRSLEWSGTYWDSVSGEVLSVCPECDAPHSDMGHLVDCKLEALLQSEKGEQ